MFGKVLIIGIKYSLNKAFLLLLVEFPFNGFKQRK